MTSPQPEAPLRTMSASPPVSTSPPTSSNMMNASQGSTHTHGSERARNWRPVLMRRNRQMKTVAMAADDSPQHDPASPMLAARAMSSTHTTAASNANSNANASHVVSSHEFEDDANSKKNKKKTLPFAGNNGGGAAMATPSVATSSTGAAHSATSNVAGLTLSTGVTPHSTATATISSISATPATLSSNNSGNNNNNSTSNVNNNNNNNNNNNSNSTPTTPAVKKNKLQRILGFGGGGSAPPVQSEVISQLGDVALTEAELFRLPLLTFDPGPAEHWRARTLSTTYEVTIQSTGREDLLRFGSVFAGRSMSTYPFNVPAKCRDGDPIADNFAVRVYDNRVVAALADGCGWGLASALAARTAVRTFNSFVKARRHALGNARHAAQLVIDAFCAAHVDVCKTPTDHGQIGTTTLAGGVLLAMSAPRHAIKSAAAAAATPATPTTPPTPVVAAAVATPMSVSAFCESGVVPPAPDDDGHVEVPVLEDLPVTKDDDRDEGSCDAQDRLVPDDNDDDDAPPVMEERRMSAATAEPLSRGMAANSFTNVALAAAAAEDAEGDRFAFVFACVGDVKVFHCAVRPDGHCTVTDVTRGDIKSQSSEAKFRAEDPGGRMGPQLPESAIDARGKGTRADLRNLYTRCVPCARGDIFLMMSDGVGDNLDPEVLGQPSKSGVPWKDISEADQRAEKSEWAANYLSTTMRKCRFNLTEFVRVVIRFCADTTRPSRRFMEANPGRSLPTDYTEFSGKQDHTSIIAFSVFFGKPVF
jgi:hypothetical protein